MNTCPCCHQPVAIDLLVSLDANAMARNGIIVRLQPQSAVVLDLLKRRYPAAVPQDTILEAMNGWRESESVDPHKVLKVRISMIRRLLKPLNVGIEYEVDRGYRLHVA